MINSMKKEDINWMPPVRDDEHGWLIIDGKDWWITDWHHYDDFGQSIETVRATRDGKEVEVYSMDEGLTWHTELND